MRNASARFATTIASDHVTATRVQVLVAGTPSGDPIDTVEQGAVTLDATAATRGRVDVAIVDDGTRGLVPTVPTDLLAPYGNEIQVSRGLRYPDDTEEFVSVGVFRIDRSTPTSSAQGTMIRVSGRDRSARIIDARFEEPYQVAAGTNYTTAILNVLQAAWPQMPYDFTATTRVTPQLFAEEGADRWAFAQEMAAAIGFSLHFDGDGVCILAPVMVAAGGTVATFAEGDGGVLLDAGKEWVREGAFNRVIATGENTGESTNARGVATDDDPSSPTYYYGDFGKVPRFYVSSFITTSAQAQDAAAAILAREMGTTQRVDFGTVVDPRLEPDDVVQISRALLGIDEAHVLDAVTIPLSANEKMTGRTRVMQVFS